MAPPPPAALGAGMAREAASHCSRFFEGLGGGGGGVPAWGGLRGRSSGIPSFAANRSLLRAKAEAALRPPGLPGAGALASAALLWRGTVWNAGVFLRASPRSRGCVCPHRVGGVGALCAVAPFPRVLESRVACGGAARHRGSL